jgi:hypothetical protein
MTHVDQRLQQRLLIIGQWQRAEFAELSAFVHSLTDWQLVTAPDVATACGDHTDAERRAAPSFILLLESWPDEYTAADLQTLYTHWPTSGWLCVTGSWSAAAGRSRNLLWPPGLRVGHEVGIAELTRRLTPRAVAPEDRPSHAVSLPAWALTRDQVATNRLEAADRAWRDQPATHLANDLIIVDTPDAAVFEWLSELLSAAGATVLNALVARSQPIALTAGTTSSQLGQPVRLIWDREPENPARRAQLAAWRRDLPGIRVVHFSERLWHSESDPADRTLADNREPWVWKLGGAADLLAALQFAGSNGPCPALGEQQV